MHSAQENAGLKHRVSNDACDCSGPQAIARFGANLTSDDCTPHSVRKDIKPSSKPYMSMGSTAIPGGSAISSCGQTSFFAMAVKERFDFDKGCKWPKQRHFIDADIRPHFTVFVTVCILGYKKQKTGIGERSCLPHYTGSFQIECVCTFFALFYHCMFEAQKM